MAEGADLGYADLGCQGSKEIRTPHIDMLAASGLRCKHRLENAARIGVKVQRSGLGFS